MDVLLASRAQSALVAMRPDVPDANAMLVSHLSHQCPECTHAQILLQPHQVHHMHRKERILLCALMPCMLINHQSHQLTHGQIELAAASSSALQSVCMYLSLFTHTRF